MLRSFRGEGGNAGRRVNVRSGSISSNNHGLHHAHDSFCQKRHSYAFQDDKMVKNFITIWISPSYTLYLVLQYTIPHIIISSEFLL